MKSIEYEQLTSCSYINWHEKFSKIELDSVIVAIPKHIVEYLLDEMIILPKECYENQIQEDDSGEDDALETPVIYNIIQNFQYELSNRE